MGLWNRELYYKYDHSFKNSNICILDMGWWFAFLLGLQTLKEQMNKCFISKNNTSHFIVIYVGDFDTWRSSIVYIHRTYFFRPNWIADCEFTWKWSIPLRLNNIGNWKHWFFLFKHFLIKQNCKIRAPALISWTIHWFSGSKLS